MEILIIGNGFDLEHNLPTSYKDFLEFCRRVRRIYTYKKDAILCTYVKDNLEDWEIDTYIKEKLANAFKGIKNIVTKRIKKRKNCIYGGSRSN